MKKIIFLIVALSQFAINGFSQNYSNFIAIEQVEVLVDNIREERIEEQICDIARSQFSKICDKLENQDFFAIKIEIRQRSYYKDIDNRNSIYLHYSVFDDAGAIIAEESFFTEGESSILSAKTQTKQVSKAAQSIKKTLKNFSGKNNEAFIAKR